MLVLLRHAESLSNRDKIMTGQSNAQLSDEGIQQAKEVGRTYRSYSWDAIFTSDLDR